MAHPQALTFTHAAALCRRAIGDSDARATLLAQYRAGWLKCWRLGRCVLMTRGEGDELVIVCAEGAELVAAGQVIFNAARAEGFARIRFHTRRPALARLLRRWQFKPEPGDGETIFTLEL